MRNEVFLLIVKILQLWFAVGVVVLFILPQGLIVNKAVSIETNTKIQAPVLQPTNLYCTNKPSTHDDEIADLYAALNLDDKIYRFENDSQLITVAKCYKEKMVEKPLNVECFCLGSYYILSVVSISGAMIVYTIIDLSLLCPARSNKIHKSSGRFCSMIFTIFAFVCWITVGSVVLYYLIFRWAFSVITEDEVRKPYFLPPFFFWVAAGLCYGFAVLALVECSIFSVLIMYSYKKDAKDQSVIVRQNPSASVRSESLPVVSGRSVSVIKEVRKSQKDERKSEYNQSSRSQATPKPKSKVESTLKPKTTSQKVKRKEKTRTVEVKRKSEFSDQAKPGKFTVKSKNQEKRKN